jgi:hypothetical protein
VADAIGRITLFTASDVAREEFQRHHRFWYDGADTVQGQVEHRIAFMPTGRTASIDWAGVLSIDATAVLKRSDVRLTNLSPGSRIASSNCVVDYGEIAPTLALERAARCWTVNRDRRDEIVYDSPAPLPPLPQSEAGGGGRAVIELRGRVALARSRKLGGRGGAGGATDRARSMP